MQYYILITDNVTAFVSADGDSYDEIIKEFKKLRPDVKMPEDERVPILFPITELEFVNKDQGAVISRLNRQMTKLLKDYDEYLKKVTE